MTFLYVAALGIVLWVVAPIAAHLLLKRRPLVQAFPPAKLIEVAPHKARARSQIQDILLLVVRAGLVAALALLGAVPMIQCAGPALMHRQGASLAFVLVVDDSLSMRAKRGGSSLLKQAVDASEKLIDESQPGDAIGIVLAGEPARVLLAPTSSSGAAKQALRSIVPTDRGTDIEGAIDLARSVLSASDQAQRQVIVFSDLLDGHAARGPLSFAKTSNDITISFPWGHVDGALHDCAVLSARREAARVVALIGCTDRAQASGRHVVVRDQGRALGQSLIQPEIIAPGSPVRVTIPVSRRPGANARVELTSLPSDQIPMDDTAAVIPAAASNLAVGVVERSQSNVATGGPPAIEQALEAIGADLVVRPLSVVPDAADSLATFSMLVLDDPSALSPEQRRALRSWVQRGGFVFAGLGPQTSYETLGSSYETLVHGAPRWERDAPDGVIPEAWVGPNGPSLAHLAAKGRAVLHPSSVTGQSVRLRWTDHEPWLVERRHGRGIIWTFGLPFDPSVSDFVLRPGFVSLLGDMVMQARKRRGSNHVQVGRPWRVTGASRVEVISPEGNAVDVRTTGQVTEVIPDRSGRWEMRVDGVAKPVIATIAARELDPRPRGLSAQLTRHGDDAQRARVDVSRYVVVLAGALMMLEALLRAIRLAKSRGRTNVSLA